MYKQDDIIKIKDKIVKDLANGRSLREIIKKGRKQDSKIKIPTRPIIYEWLNANHDKYDAIFLNNYVRAREDSADVDSDRLEKIAMDVLKGDLEPAQARVAADIIKWTAGKKKPKKYGEKLDLTTDGKELTQQVTVFQLPTNGRDKSVEDGEGN